MSYLDAAVNAAWAMIFGIAVDTGLQPDVFCEDLLLAPGYQKQTNDVFPAMIVRSKTARQRILMTFAELEDDSAASLCAHLKKKENQMLAIDKHFKIVTHLFHSMTGQFGKERFEER